MQSSNDNSLPDRNHVRALVLHHKADALSLDPDSLAQHGCFMESAAYGAPALRLLARKDFDALIVCVKTGHSGPTIAFVREIARIWPWLPLVVYGSDSEKEIRDVAATLRTPHILARSTTDKEFCETVIKAAAAGSAKRPAESEILTDEYCTALRSLPYLVQSSLQTPTLVSVIDRFSHSLDQLMPHDIIGILGINDEVVLSLMARDPINPQTVECLQSDILSRLYGFTGRDIEKDLIRVQRDHVRLDDSLPAQPARCLSVPILDEENVIGLCTVADLQENSAFSINTVRLLTLVAGHIGSALVALRGMRSLGSHDPLTGLLNRTGLEDILERTWWMSRRYQFPMGIAVVDVDYFKTINDSYDHSIGDQVLREFSVLMKSMCRASDVAARYAGDEFVAILPQADEEGVRSFAERLLEATANHVFLPQDRRISLTVSVGVATSLAPIPPTTSDDLLNRADRALLTAKREGRNRSCIWPDQTGVVVARRAPADDKPNAKEPGQRIMVVDDEKTILTAFKHILESGNHEVETFSSADDAIARLKIAAEDEFAVILTDLSMPGKDGIQFLHEIRAQSELAVKIIITGFATVDSTVSGLREGVFDIIQKPVRAADLMAAVRRAQEYRRLRIDNVRYREHLEELVLERSAQLASSLEEIRKSHEFTLEAMVAMLDAREDQTARHSIRVRELSVALAERMNFEEADLETIAMAALLHDIGKISVPDAVLLKPGPLLPEEWDIMRKHPETGYRILMTGSYLKDVAELVYAHHERYDGTGYPRGIHGKNIPVGARVFAVIDAYEAMRSERAYRSPLTQEQAVKEIKKNRGTQFDPDVVDIFLKNRPEMERLLAEGTHHAAGGHKHWRASQLRHQSPRGQPSK